ncbi:TRAP transporter small permease [Stella sp.]|uniref:TRAP transporter small permease n=1 Tax=Stella sp. TaxID=2912054 RepID=UPI0035AEB512
MDGVWRGLDRLFTGLLWLAVVAGMLMTTFVVLASVMRYFVGSPFRFTEELVGLLFVGLAFLGLPWTTMRNRHLRITLIPDMLPPAVRRLTDLLGMALVLVFLVVFAWQSWEFASFSLMLNARSDMGGIPLFPWMVLLPSMCAAAAVGVVVRRLHGGAEDDDAGPGV